MDKLIEYAGNLREAFDGLRIDPNSINANMRGLFDTNAALQSKMNLTGDEVQSLSKAAVILGQPLDKLAISTIVIGDKIIGAKNALKEMAKVSKSILIAFRGTTKELIMSVTK